MTLHDKKKFTYLNKDMSQKYQRKRNDFVEIIILNHSKKRIKISKSIQERLNKILKELHLENGEWII